LAIFNISFSCFPSLSLNYFLDNNSYHYNNNWAKST
jgi:hypothetical protein